MIDHRQLQDENNKRVIKQNTLLSDSSRQKSIIGNNMSQDIEYNKTSYLLRKNKNNCSQNFEKITASDKQLKKNSSNYSRASNTNKKYYSSINSNSERSHEVSTKNLRKDIRELKKKYQKNVNSKKKSSVNITSSYKPERSTKKRDRPARVKAALICKLSLF